MDILAILAEPINGAGKWLFGKLKIQFRLVYHYNDNFIKLGNQITDLKKKKNDIETKLKEAEANLEVAYEEVQAWLKKVEGIQSRVEDIQSRVTNRNEEVRANRRCLLGLCPDLCSRRRLSEEADGLQDWVENLNSRVEITEQVEALLHVKEVKSIGVYGMGGIGKTTLVKTVNNRLQGTEVFKKVILLVVSKDPNTRTIQHEIAERLRLKFEDGSSEAIKADRLHQRLKAEEPVLIILDDVWNVLDLARIGIPCGNLDVGCKLIITTRNRNVCTGMGIEPIYQIEIGILSPEESMILFKEKVGDAAESPALRPIAEDIVARCKGSPLAISTIGSFLQGGEEFDWKDALRALENPNPSDLQEIMQPVIDSLKFSYDRLEGEGIKLCFLFCCLFPEDYNISVTELRNYGVGEDFLKVNGTLEDAANKLRVYIKKLKDRGLLLEGDKEGHVKMHDVVRDVAIWIASKEKGFSVNVGKRSADSLEIQNYKRVSFMNIENLELSAPLDCPNLRTLMIRSSSESRIDEESSFERMTTLVILEMRNDYMRELWSVPKSLEYLTNLQALFLVGCDLSSKISMIGRMKKLKILDLQYSEIGELPEEIGNLSNLKRLNLTRAKFSAVAPGVMSKLTNLEELYARTGHFQGWNKEVASLVNLSSLEICLRHEVLESASFSFPWKNLKHFHVFINWSFPDEDETKNGLYLREVNPTSNLIYKSLCNLTHELKLVSCHGFKDVADLVDLQVGGFKNLEYVEVRESDSVEYLMSFEEDSAKNCLQDSFQGLKRLKIYHLVNMKKIVQGRLKFVNLPPLGANSTSPCFQNLKYLRIEQCPKLESIFPFSIAQCLPQLIELDILDCPNLVYVIEKDEKEELGSAVQHHPVPDPILPSLKCLWLQNLPILEGIYQGNLQFNSPLEHVIVRDCPNLRKLPLGPQAISTLKRFSGEGLDLQVGGFKNLEYLDVSGSDEVEYLRSFEEESRNCLQDSFQGLKEPKIDGLVNMKKIVHGRLKFFNLPPLGTNSTSPCFQNLEYLSICQCPKLESIFPFSIAQCLPQLIELTIGDCPNLVCVIEKDEEEEGEGEKEEIALAVQRHPVLLPSLKHLSFTRLPSLEGIYQGNLQLHSPLERVKVRECPNLRKLPLGPQAISTLKTFKGKSEYLEGLDLQLGGFKNLECLEVRESDSVEYLMSFEEESRNCLQDYFQGLKGLEISMLVNMKKIVHGRLKFVNLPPLRTNSTSPCFQNLEYLSICQCPKLESIFPFRIAQCLPQLIELTIGDCPNLVCVIEKDEEEEGEGEKEELALAVQRHPVPDPIVVLLPSLTDLWLTRLPSLEGIYQGNLQFNSPLESVFVRDCPNLRKLPLGPQAISTLKTFYGEPEWFETLEWEDDSIKSHLRTIFEDIDEDQ